MKVLLTCCCLWTLLVYCVPQRRSGFITVSPAPRDARACIQRHRAIAEVFPGWEFGLRVSPDTNVPGILTGGDLGKAPEPGPVGCCVSGNFDFERSVGLGPIRQISCGIETVPISDFQTPFSIGVVPTIYASDQVFVVDQYGVILYPPTLVATVPLREHPLCDWADGVDWFQVPEPFVLKPKSWAMDSAILPSPVQGVRR